MKFRRNTIISLIHIFLASAILIGCTGDEGQQVFRVEILIADDHRQEALSGFYEGMSAFGYEEGINVIYKVHNAKGDRDSLQGLAEEILKSNPDVAVAAFGIEADALRAATDGSSLPVVFIAASSAIERGLAESMLSSGNNFTGIETNDANLTAKRLEFISIMFPQATNVLIFHVPSISPSVQSVEIAKETAPLFNLNLDIYEVENEDDIQRTISELNPENVDVILSLPSSPVWAAMENTIFPFSVTYKIPIFGVNRGDIGRGAVASYSSSRYELGIQSARLVRAVLEGQQPSDLPIETPEILEFLINSSVAKILDLEIPKEIMIIVDEIVINAQ